MAASEIDRDHILEQMRLRETDELIEILKQRDTEEWRPEVFPLVEEVLAEREVDIAAELGRTQSAASARPRSTCELATATLLAASSEALACRTALDHGGIASLELHRESVEAGGWQLLVHAEDVGAAREILAELRESLASVEDAEVENAEALIACARCGSTDVAATETGPLGAVLEQLFGAPVAKCSVAHRCRECDYGWIE
jgi:hypothetical protein